MNNNREFLNYFWDLASEESQKRITAADNVFRHCESCDGFNADVEYALKRLIRGLSSSRECARQGFASCLTGLLTLPCVEIGNTISCLDENTKVN